MKYTNILGKISVLFTLIKSSYIYLIFLGILLILTLVLFIKKKNKSKVVVLMLISYLILLTLTIINNYQELSKVFDSIATHLFTDIYFPSTQVYLFTLTVVDIIALTSMLNKKAETNYKVANMTCFFTTKFLMVLILDIISKNKIDIFSKKSMFTNNNLVILLEISISVFIIWLLSLIVLYITNKAASQITEHQEEKTYTEAPVPELYTSVSKQTIKEEPALALDIEEEPLAPSLATIPALSTFTEYKAKENNYNLNTPNSNITTNIEAIPEKEESIPTLNIKEEVSKPTVEPEVTSDILLDKLLHNGLPIIKENKEIIKEEAKEISPITKEDYTLNDYRIFNKMLKEVRDNNGGNIIKINKELEQKLIAKYSYQEYGLFKGMLKNYSN